MATLRYRILGLIAATAIAIASSVAYAEDAVTAQTAAQDEQMATPVPAPSSAPADLPKARAEVARPAASAASKPKTGHINTPARAIVVAQRERCWLYCGQTVLMLGVAY